MPGRLLGGLRPLEHHGVEGRGKELVVAYVRPGHHHRKRTAVGLDQKGAFHPVLAPVGRAGAYEVPPKRALPIATSATCHSKFTPPKSSHSSTKAAQARPSTPSSTHRCKVRCTVESSGTPWVSGSTGSPSWKMTASSTARRSVRGRP